MVMCRLSEVIMYRLLFAHPPASTSQNERTSVRFDSIVVERVQSFGAGRAVAARSGTQCCAPFGERKCEEVATATSTIENERRRNETRLYVIEHFCWTSLKDWSTLWYCQSSCSANVSAEITLSLQQHAKAQAIRGFPSLVVSFPILLMSCGEG